MALTIEDGTIVTGANSYVTLIEIRAFTLARGLDLSAVDDADIEALAIKAMDYLEAQRGHYQGKKTEPGTQALQWPRKGVYIDCDEILDQNEIPQELKDAQCQLVIEGYNSVVLQPTETGGETIREVLDDIEIEYSRNGGVTASPVMSAVRALLDPLFFRCGNKFTFNTIRV